MISKSRKYFTFFGILAATVDRKIHSLYCTIDNIKSNLPNINRLLLANALKPVKLYSTNNIKH